MIIKSVHVQNFRSILDEAFDCENLTTLVGPNGSGKSCFLRALDLFYTATPRVSPEDFYADDTTKDIEITVTFEKLTRDAAEQFEKYVENGTLTVVRVISMAGTSVFAKYHGSALQNPEFAPVRQAEKAADKKAAYQSLQETATYADLPKWTKQEQGLAALKDWEQAHTEACTRARDDGQFFGFAEVAQGYLGRFTRFIYVPAVRDAAADAAEGKGAPITELMDLVVRSALASRADLTTLKEHTQKAYDDIMDPAKLTELTQLGGQLTATLKTYVPDASIELAWLNGGAIELPMPKALVKLVEDGYPSTVVRTGHGLQRAFIFTMLQHLAVARVSQVREAAGDGAAESDEDRAAASASSMPNLVLCIEEPELYQHPSRQRHFAKILHHLATGVVPGVASNTQVIYATHSPLFVGTDRFDQVRVLRKVGVPNERPKITNVIRAKLDDVADELWKARGSPDPRFTGETLRPRLQAIMTPWMNEGFFADVIVLVEGEDDRAAVLGAAISTGHDLESNGVAVIPCMGKNNIDRPLVIFRSFGIPTYVVWDGDEGNNDAKPGDNRYLLGLLGHKAEDWPSCVTDTFACFKRDLETTLREDIGSGTFDKLLQAAQEDLGIASKARALKNPVVVRRIVEGATAEGKRSTTMESVVEKIVARNPARSGE